MAALSAIVVLLSSATDTAAVAATFTVNSTADTDDGICDVANCTLREAINASNANPGKDTIAFAIPGAGPHTIQPIVDLPLIFEPVVLDATSQPGYVGTPLIALDGSAGASTGFTTFVGGMNEIRGFAIGGFNTGIVIVGNGNVIQSNHIGIDPAGLAAAPNTVGVGISGSSQNLIGGPAPADRNLISGNLSDGVRVFNADNNQISGNLIGSDITGSVAVGNGVGVSILLSSDNVVGGSASGQGNLISGNQLTGVDVSGDSNMNVIQGNLIGTDMGGVSALPNQFGVMISGASSHNEVGGSSNSERNVISGNSIAGVLLFYESAHNQIAGNLIGTDVTGTQAVGNGAGVSILGTDNVIGGIASGEGNVISGNDVGVEISDETSIGNVIQGNLIGTSADGLSSIPNEQQGVLIWNAGNNIVGGGETGARNVISGSQENVLIQGFGQANGNVIQGNYIGTDITGTVALGASQSGVSISDAGQTLVGGPLAGHRNVISGNEFEVLILNSSTETMVQGNYIGLDATGTARLGGQIGIEILFAQNSIIGGDAPSLGNAIGSPSGIELTGASANVIRGNYIGTDATGNALPQNSARRDTGIFLRDSRDNLIGGTTEGAGNVISGHDIGIGTTGGSAGNDIEGNLIGVGADGVTPLGNTFAGVLMASSGNSIGGLSPAAGNTIAHNGFGVVLDFGGETPILSNEIFANAFLGIDLGDDGVTANDLGDGDSGANGLQNFPDLTSAETDDIETVVQGTLNSLPDQTFTLQFLSNAACDESGFGEGENLLRTSQVTTSVVGDAQFSVTIPSGVPEGHFITATATDPDGNTSEFSQCLAVETSRCHDLNDDGRVNGRDVAIVARALPSAPGHKRWNPDADLNHDGVVDVRDLMEVLLSMRDPACD